MRNIRAVYFSLKGESLSKEEGIRCDYLMNDNRSCRTVIMAAKKDTEKLWRKQYCSDKSKTLCCFLCGSRKECRISCAEVQRLIDKKRIETERLQKEEEQRAATEHWERGSNEIWVPTRTEIKFPSMCSKCLGETNLTTYAAKYEKSYHVNIPICNSCKKHLLWEARKRTTHHFPTLALILWPIFLGLSYFIYTQNWWPELIAGALGGRGAIGGLVYIGILFVVILPGAIPLLALADFISPERGSEVSDRAPVRIVDWIIVPSSYLFHFENETYCELFYAANPSSRLTRK